MLFLIAFVVIWAFFGFNHAFEAAFAMSLLALILGFGAAPGILVDKVLKDRLKNRKNNS